MIKTLKDLLQARTVTTSLPICDNVKSVDGSPCQISLLDVLEDKSTFFKNLYFDQESEKRALLSLVGDDPCEFANFQAL